MGGENDDRYQLRSFEDIHRSWYRRFNDHGILVYVNPETKSLIYIAFKNYIVRHTEICVRMNPDDEPGTYGSGPEPPPILKGGITIDELVATLKEELPELRRLRYGETP